MTSVEILPKLDIHAPYGFKVTGYLGQRPVEPTEPDISASYRLFFAHAASLPDEVSEAEMNPVSSAAVDRIE
jgi:hypothetical protein